LNFSSGLAEKFCKELATLAKVGIFCLGDSSSLVPSLQTHLNFSSGLAEKLRKELATLAKFGIFSCLGDSSSLGTVLTHPVEFFFWIGRKVLQRVGNTGKSWYFPA
jgi:hypothetical protein